MAIGNNAKNRRVHQHYIIAMNNEDQDCKKLDLQQKGTTQLARVT